MIEDSSQLTKHLRGKKGRDTVQLCFIPGTRHKLKLPFSNHTFHWIWKPQGCLGIIKYFVNNTCGSILLICTVGTSRGKKVTHLYTFTQRCDTFCVTALCVISHCGVERELGDTGVICGPPWVHLEFIPSWDSEAHHRGESDLQSSGSVWWLNKGQT